MIKTDAVVKDIFIRGSDISSDEQSGHTTERTSQNVAIAAALLLAPQTWLCFILRAKKPASGKHGRSSASRLIQIKGGFGNIKVYSVASAMRSLLALDEIAIVSCSGLTYWGRLTPTSVEFAQVHITLLAMFSAGLTVIFRRCSAPALLRNREPPMYKAIRAASATAVAACTIVSLCALLLPSPARTGLGWYAVGWVVLVSVAVGMLHYIVGAATERIGGPTVRAVLVSSPERAEDLARVASTMHGWKWLPHHRSATHEDRGALVDLAKSGSIDVVVLDAASTSVAEICRALAEIPVRICSAVEADSLGAVPQTDGLLLTDLAVSPPRPSQAAVKRIIDVLLSVLGLVLILPFLGGVALAIRCETKGAVIFRQWRSGQGGRPFKVLKFRTMYIDDCDLSAEKQTARGDSRVTNVGRILRRTSIDELPQLINVIRGDMSLVGPRAHPIHMKIDGWSYSDAVSQYGFRHRVRPGMTGWAQVNGSRGGVNNIAGARRRVALDLFYLRNWTILLDFEILFRTICGGFIVTKD